MAPRSTLPRGDAVPVCTETVEGHYCGKRHLTHDGTQACTWHVVLDRAGYVKGQKRPKLPEPRPCRKSAVAGTPVCNNHGGMAPRVRGAGTRRIAEARVEAAARKLIPEVADRTVIDNPLKELLALASEANAFRESLRIISNGLEGRIRGDGNTESIRAEVTMYRQALKDTTDILGLIARLDIEKILARVTLVQAEQSLAAFRAGCDAAGLTEDQRRSVMTNAARHLRAVAG